MALGDVQKRLLVEIFKRLEEEFARWREKDALPLAGTAEERAHGLDRTAPAVKAPLPMVEAPWAAILRRLNPDEDPRVGKNLARAADSLEDRGLIWIEPPRTGRYRRRKTCGLTFRGRVEAEQAVMREGEALVDRTVRTESRHSEIVRPHYQRWQATRTELESRLRDEDFANQASDEVLAGLVRALTQARVLQEYANRVLPEIEADHLEPDPPGGATAVLTLTFSTRFPYNPVDEETMAFMNEMVRDVASRASAKKRAAQPPRILNPLLGEDED